MHTLVLTCVQMSASRCKSMQVCASLCNCIHLHTFLCKCVSHCNINIYILFYGNFRACNVACFLIFSLFFALFCPAARARVFVLMQNNFCIFCICKICICILRLCKIVQNLHLHNFLLMFAAYLLRLKILNK